MIPEKHAKKGINKEVKSKTKKLKEKNAVKYFFFLFRL